MTHSATVLAAARTIELTERSLPDAVPEGHVRLALATASLCGTDLHYYRHFANAGFELQRPVTLGHEACAYVTDPNGSDFAPGQLVALNPIIFCGECENCRAGQENYCTAKKFPGSATTVPHIDGFFQARFDFPAFCCHAVPEGTDPDHLTFTEPLACAMHSVTVSRAGAGDRVLVTGCGPMGLLAVVAARSAGAEVDVTDIRPEAVELARKIGAGAGFVAGKDAPPSGAYDAVIEASGSPHAFNQALDAARRQGRVSILSNIQLSDTPVHLHRIMLKELTVAGSFQFNVEFRQALELITSGRQDFEQLVAARFPLSQTADALELMLSGKAAGKILIKPEE
ncbi:zinc-dependent alcohol dehydrogenase [Oricola thermophila]|uniref:Alcohol dehydrogenase catalytic domain-containing protein n=1 Tax=Oricola thermophila TaxID=2742145 RepID=A0A6N1VJK0_9HYPH|nr:alcohol dehydrogenase catalytic domain-containing protein [Oricola thermophila]QKV19097.1 alcohol dehydrogenase catalytic domain-containing protein [Oricola thermophila]